MATPARGARSIALSLLAISGLAVASLTGCHRPPRRVDRVLLITLDTVRADALAAYGGSTPTPHLDALAARGVRFDQAMSPVPLTGPAHATLLTGRYPWQHGLRLNGVALDASAPLLTERMAAAGLRPAAFVAGQPLALPYGFDRGMADFDDHFGQTSRGRPRAQRTAGEVVDRATAWLDAHASEPFFLWVHLFDAHAPYEPPEPYRSRHPSDLYAGEIAYVDAEVGRLLASLDRLGLTATTLVVVVGDHGEGRGDHGEDEHGLLVYEDTLRVPLLVAGPGFSTGRVVAEPVSLVDVAPTIVAAIGAPTLPDTAGVDLAPVARGGRLAERAILAETLYPEHEFGWSRLLAVRVGSRKVIAGPRPELYDLATDPGERHDLARDRADEVAALLRHLDGIDALAVAASAPGADAVAALESLGYVAGSGPAPTAAGADDPRDHLDDYRLYWRGFRLGWEGSDDERRQAVPLFEELVARDPTNPEFRHRYAALLARLGRFDDAERVYSTLLADFPDWQTAVRSAAEMRIAAGRPREAIALVETYLAAHPGTVGLTDTEAMAHRGAGDLERAVAVARAAATRAPRDVAAQLLLGHLAGEAGLLDDSLAAFILVLDLDPGNSQAALSQSRVLEALHRSADALPALRASLARHPGDLGVTEECCRLAHEQPTLPGIADLCRIARGH